MLGADGEGLLPKGGLQSGKSKGLDQLPHRNVWEESEGEERRGFQA